MMEKVIGIVGKGVVGFAIGESFKSVGYEVLYYDKYKPSNTLKEVVEKSAMIFVCVPTPLIPKKGIDLSILNDVIDNIDKYAKKGQMVIIKSTVVPGTTQAYQDKYKKMLFFMSPEFLDADTAQYDARHPDKTIIGHTNESADCVNRLIPLFKHFNARMFIMSSIEAEMVKYTTNAFFVLKNVFANEIYDLCVKTGCDYEDVREAFVSNNRIGDNTHLKVFHKGGRGAGGACLPKDIGEFVCFANEKGVAFELLKTAEKLNNKLLKDNGKC